MLSVRTLETQLRLLSLLSTRSVRCDVPMSEKLDVHILPCLAVLRL